MIYLICVLVANQMRFRMETIVFPREFPLSFVEDQINLKTFSVDMVFINHVKRMIYLK